MFLDQLLNQGSGPLLEQWLQFSDARQKLIAEDVVNANTPGYIQKDLSLEKFRMLMRKKIAQRDSSGPGTVHFDDIQQEIEHPKRGMLFHDGNNRSMEQLMSDQAKTALMYNFAIELLRKQYSTMDMALKEKAG
jgi:flagellar basal-body rod protein FlgB